MKKVKLVLKSIGAAVLMIVAFAAFMTGFVYVAAKLSDIQFLICCGAVILLAAIIGLSTSFYAKFSKSEAVDE